MADKQDTNPLEWTKLPSIRIHNRSWYKVEIVPRDRLKVGDLICYLTDTSDNKEYTISISPIRLMVKRLPSQTDLHAWDTVNDDINRGAGNVFLAETCVIGRLVKILHYT